MRLAAALRSLKRSGAAGIWRRSGARLLVQIAIAMIASGAAQALPNVIPFDGPAIGIYTYGFDINNPDLGDLAVLPPDEMDAWLVAVPRSNPYGTPNDDILLFADVAVSLYSRCTDPSAPCSSNYSTYDVTWNIELNPNHPLVTSAPSDSTFSAHLILPGWERSGFGQNQVNVFSDSFQVDGASASVEVSSWKNTYFFLSMAIQNMTPGPAGLRTVRLQYDMVGAEPVVQGVTQVPSLQLMGSLTVVPEPGTFTLVAFGLVGLAGMGSRVGRR